MLSVVMLNAVKWNVIVLNAIKWNTIMLSVVAPIWLYHPSDGITNTKYKLLHFLTTRIYLIMSRMHQLLIRISAAI
jgi:hypothetical protein